MPDRWELANGFDPFTRGEDSLDRDKDGLTNLEEYQNNLNPSNPFTRGPGRSDFAEANAEVDLSELVEIRLRAQDTGKVNNGANCAVCHTTELRVGDLKHFSPRPEATERSFFLRKGTNYPIYLSDLLQSIPRPNQNPANPSSSGTYTAAILPPTNSPRAFVFTDPQNRLGTNKVWTTWFPPNPTVPIGTVTVPRIEVLWTNLAGNVALDTNSNAGGGVRVFPDRQHWTDGTARNVVGVRVRTIPPLPAGQQIRLKSFDVDDPMYPLDATDTFVDTNDVGNAKGDDNRGTPRPGQLASTLLTLGANGEATVNFTVTLHPGDNFRIAAVLETPGAQAHLDNLQVTNPTAPFYVAADSSHPAKFVGGVSSMLTVWRKLHLEFDSMVAPPTSGFGANHVSGTIKSVQLNQPVPGRSVIQVVYQAINMDDNYGIYGRGKLEIPGIGTFKTTTNTSTLIRANGRAATFVELDAAPAGIQVGTTVKLYDDDDQFLTNDGTYLSQLTLQSPPLPVDNRSVEFITNIQHRFSDAYIQLVSANTNAWNTQSTIPFHRQADPGAIFDSGNQQLKGADQPAFWAYTVIFAYEPLFDEDGEPNREVPLDGVTKKRNPLLLSFHGYSVIYMEATRESIFGVGRGQPKPVVFQDHHFNDQGLTNTLRREYLTWLYGGIAHEIGHAPGGQSEGGDHAEKGLMQEGGDFINGDPFFPLTIRRFRDAVKWLP